eukprot:11185261-Lingulodinium_polyedra.AAC.1
MAKHTLAATLTCYPYETTREHNSPHFGDGRFHFLHPNPLQKGFYLKNMKTTLPDWQKSPT